MLKIDRTITGSEALTLDEAKDFLRVDYDTDNELITNLITQSRDLVEQYTDRSLINSDIVLTASPRVEFVLPYGPVGTLASVVTQDDSTVLDYEYDTLTLKVDTLKTFVVTYDTEAAVEPGLKLAWLETIAYLYENRGDTANIGLILYYNKNLQPYRNRVWI